MGKGQLFPPESRSVRDGVTGAAIRQVTGHPSIHHQPFYYLPAYDNQMQRLIFVSHRSGRPEVFAELRNGGALVQLTEQADISEWSVHPSHDGRYVYYTAAGGAWRVSTESCRAEKLVNFGDLAGREEGMVGAAMGTTTVSHDDRWWAVPVKMGAVFRLLMIDTALGQAQVILERDTIGHPEFHPSDSSLLRYAGPYYDRMWVINRDGSGNRLIYRRSVEKKEWIVHETWRPGSYEIVVSNWPHGMIGVDVNSGAVRRVCSFNAWHASINRQGTLMCCDTTYPDKGLQIFSPTDGVGVPTTLCLSKSSNIGAHWDTDHCPYDDAKIKPYSPQHTHPHPAFSPDGRYVVFTSDRSGFSQVYEVALPGQTR